MRDQKPGLSSKIRVGIIGGNSPDKKSLEFSGELGKLLALNDFILVNGGMSGVMEASARSAKSRGGMVISILPGTNKTEGHDYADIKIMTGLGYMRNSLVVLNSDILVAIDGSYGTLSEISYAKIYGKRVLGFSTWKIEGVEHFFSPEKIISEIKNHFDLN